MARKCKLRSRATAVTATNTAMLVSSGASGSQFSPLTAIAQLKKFTRARRNAFAHGIYVLELRDISRSVRSLTHRVDTRQHECFEDEED